MTQDQLLKFIEVRNKSQFSSNFQFETDAEECGFSATDLGQTVPTLEEGFQWETPYGILTESKAGKLSLA